MAAFLIVYFCTGAAMLDCQAHMQASWRGTYAPQQCEIAAAFERKRLQRAYSGVIFTRAICEIEPVGE